MWRIVVESKKNTLCIRKIEYYAKKHSKRKKKIISKINKYFGIDVMPPAIKSDEIGKIATVYFFRKMEIPPPSSRNTNAWL